MRVTPKTEMRVTPKTIRLRPIPPLAAQVSLIASRHVRIEIGNFNQ